MMGNDGKIHKISSQGFSLQASSAIPMCTVSSCNLG